MFFSPTGINRTFVRFALGFIAIVALAFGIILLVGMYAPEKFANTNEDIRAATTADCVTSTGERC